MTPTPANIGKAVGYAILTVVVGLGAFHAGKSTGAEAAPPQEHPTMSAPAITAADIDRLRQHLDDKFDAQGQRIGAVERGLAGLNGYIDAQKQAQFAAGRR